MIIRPACKREYTALPNSIFNDRRLSADTRAMIALVLSKPRGWELRPIPLSKALSRTGDKPVGRKRLNRMFSEAMMAGYMARSKEQEHQADGTWGRFIYYCGTPDDVASAIEKDGVAILPQCPEAHAAEAHAAEGHTESIKEGNLPNNIKNRNLLHHHDQPHLLAEACSPQVRAMKRTGPDAFFNGIAKVAENLNRGRERPEVIQHRIAARLGKGDVEHGYLIFGGLTDDERDQLTAQERAGKLDDAALDWIRWR